MSRNSDFSCVFSNRKINIYSQCNCLFFHYRFEYKLLEIMDHLRAALVNISSKSTSEKFRVSQLIFIFCLFSFSVYCLRDTVVFSVASLLYIVLI